ncbi:Hypothetical protein GOX1315 [Gluconobacter oxydans 621H]|uniref:Uncharacterized protein n=1 Tax=Gluconobacter oxydans (strain 621H) TaxID=290633 RepID=Q5FRC3_GLUOX|nr:Hypothetical protein GOX1315 [Gluconobacter oxydans 621H]
MSNRIRLTLVHIPNPLISLTKSTYPHYPFRFGNNKKMKKAPKRRFFLSFSLNFPVWRSFIICWAARSPRYGAYRLTERSWGSPLLLRDRY